MLKKYDEFKNQRVNEGIMDFLKKAMKGLIEAFSEVGKELASKFAQEVEKTKSLSDSKPLLEKTFTERSKGFEELTNYKTISDYIKEDLMLVELSLTTLAQKFKKNELKPQVFFEDSNNKVIKSIFDHEKSENFQGELPENMKILMEELGKKSGVENPEEKFAFESKIFEADETTQVPVQGQQTTQEGEKSLENDEEFKKFKETASSFRNDGLFKPLLSKFDNISKESVNQPNTDELAKISDQMNGSDNKESLTKMFQKLINSDKETLMNVRNALGLNKDDTPL